MSLVTIVTTTKVMNQGFADNLNGTTTCGMDTIAVARAIGAII